MDCSSPGSSVHGIFLATVWGGLPFPPSEDLSDAGIKAASSALAADSLPLSHLGSPYKLFYIQFIVLDINVNEIIHVVVCSCKPVLVCSGCCDTIPQTGWLINRKKLFLTVLEAGSLRSECQPSQVLVRAVFQTVSQSVQLLSHFSHVQFCATLWTVAHQALLSMRFSRQECWSGLGLPCPPPGDLPDPGIEPVFPTSPTFSGRFFTTSATR